MVNPSLLDHLIADKDKTPNDEEHFAPDPEIVPYVRNILLSEDKEFDQFAKTPEEKQTSEENKVEKKHQEHYLLA